VGGFTTLNKVRLSGRFEESRYIIPEPTAPSAVPGEGTNPPRLFTPGERNALAKSKVHQLSRARFMGVWVVISLISKYGCLPGVKKGEI
jgi:hypothetical protein